MEIKRINELTHSVLVSAGQLAYVEEAYGTLNLLERYDEFFMYLVREDAIVTLHTELSILEKYISIQKARHGERFNVYLENPENNKSIFIKRLSILDYFDSIFNDIINKYEGYLNFHIDCLQNNGECSLKLGITYEGGKEEVMRLLS